MHPTPHRIDPADLGVLALLLVLAVFVANAIVHAPSVVGEYKDDGIYLATAKSLADGHGYREPHLPGSPGQTKYPILYPLLLAGLWRCFPDLAARAAPLQIANTLLWAAGSWVGYLAMRRAWKLPWALPACGVSLAFVHTGTLGLLQTAMSEPLYLLCSMAGLLALLCGRAAEPGAARDRLLVAGWWPAVLAGAAYLTRIIGVAAMIAVLAELIARRRWRQVVAAALVISVTLVSRQVWRTHAAEANARHPAAAALTYDLEYSAWAPRSMGAAARVAAFNAAAVTAELTCLLLPAQMGTMEAVLQGRTSGLPLLHGLFLAVAGLTVAGAAAVWNRAALSLHVYLLVYLGLVLLWPFPPLRFLLPVFPLLATCFLAGVYATLVWLVRLGTWVSAAAPDAAAAAGGRAAPLATAGARLRTAAVVVLSGLLFYPSLRLIALQPGRGEFQVAAAGREELFELLRTQTPPTAVVCCELPAIVHLRTGRSAVPFLPWNDPLPFIYPADRKLGACGRAETRGAVQNVMDQVMTQLEGYLRATGATHVVPPGEATSQGLSFRELRFARPGWFQLIGNVQGTSVYRVALPQR